MSEILRIRKIKYKIKYSLNRFEWSKINLFQRCTRKKKAVTNI
uniref:Uncharacterized protein n=1 Tax=Onchocerca volvulus TaxID=6282 RepID=A0A8R1XZJ9_ONCVO